MLLCLRVQNFAIIEELEVAFEPGLNVLTGETGAGKSILIDALKLVLGERARPESVRAGADGARIEALFDVSDDPEVLGRLQAADCGDASDEVVVRRVIQRAGRSRSYLNGRLTSAGQLVGITSGLADICSQHEHHALTHAGRHLEVLDAFGELVEARSVLRRVYERLLGVRERLAETRESAQSRVEREDLLRYQLQEISETEPSVGELEELREERARYQHAERLSLLTAGAEDALYARDGALSEQLASLTGRIREAAELDSSLSPLCGQLAEAQAQIEEVARDLGQYARGVSADPERLAEVQARLERLDRLQRKYGGTLEAVLEHRRRAAEELSELEQLDDRRDQLQGEFDDVLEETARIALELSRERKRVAERLGKAVSAELRTLGMGEARIQVEVEQPLGNEDELQVRGAKLASSGIDRVEFLIATNRGEVPQPLRKVASGGELSRSLLALKRTLAGVGPAGLYVFDEVDAGVGGGVAEVIGRKLKEVAEHHQVICITHLAQIAAFADAHFCVTKHVRGGRTRSEIHRLTKAQQQEELARMLGGLRVTAKTRAAAAEMLRTAHA